METKSTIEEFENFLKTTKAKKAKLKCSSEGKIEERTLQTKYISNQYEALKRIRNLLKIELKVSREENNWEIIIIKNNNKTTTAIYNFFY